MSLTIAVYGVPPAPLGCVDQVVERGFFAALHGVAMTTRNDPSTKPAELPLTAFELPKWLVEPAVRSCRLFNAALDFIFYDVPKLRAALLEKDAPMQARDEKPPSRIIDFDALSDP
jgi:hypothetical protein